MITVIAAVIELDKKVLIAKRKKGKKLENKWEFPGGKLENNESHHDCLKREISEELSINIEIQNYITETVHEYYFGKIQLIAYKAKFINGDLNLIDHDEIAWVPIDKINNYDLAEADKPIVEKLKDISQMS